MHPSSCMFGPPQGTAAQFSNQTPHYNGTTSTTWQSKQMSGNGQPASAYFRCDNGFIPNRTSNWQRVTSTETFGQQLNNFISANQHHSSLNAHNGQSSLSNERFSVQNVQPKDAEFTNSCSKQDMSQLWTERHTYAVRQPIAVQKSSQLTYFVPNKEKQIVDPNCYNQLDKQISLQTTTTHSHGVLKDSTTSASSLTYNRQMVNHRHDTQTLCQEGLPAIAQLLHLNVAATQAKTPSATNLKYGAQKHIFQHSNVSQTTQQYQRQVNPAVNFADNITHKISSPRVGLDQCKLQTGTSNGFACTGTRYMHKDRVIPQRQSNNNTIHATLTTPASSNLNTPPSLPLRSGQASPTRTGLNQCKRQIGTSHGSACTGTRHMHNDRVIPQRQSNNNTVHATLTTPVSPNLGTPPSLTLRSGRASPTRKAGKPSATADYENSSFEKKSLKAIAVVQPLEQERCQEDASKNNSCDTVNAFADKSATEQQFKTSEMPQDKSCSKALDFQPSSVTTVPWTIETLTKLLEDNEKAQQKEIMELRKLNALRSICIVNDEKIKFLESNNVKLWHLSLSNKAASFCRNYVTKDCVILTQVKGISNDQLQNYFVLKHNELYSETPYKSQWLNVGELDDIDKEFGYPSCLIHGAKKQSDQEDTSIPAQIVNDKCVKGVTLIEPELTEPREKKQIPNSAERNSELAQGRAPSPVEDNSVDSSDSDLSFEIQVLPPEEAKFMFEQIQRKAEEAIAIDSPPETDTSGSDQGTLSDGGNVAEGDKGEGVLHSYYCCLPRFFSTFLKKDNSYSKCQCESAKNPQDSPEKPRTQENETAKGIKENLSVSLSCSLAGEYEETGEIKIDCQTINCCGSELRLNQPVASMENKQDRHDFKMGSIQKDKACSRHPMLYQLLVDQNIDADTLSHCAKIKSHAKVNYTDVVLDIEKTCNGTELKSTDVTSDSSEGTEEQSSSFEMATPEDVASKVKKRPCEEEHFYPTFKGSTECSNEVDGKPLCPESQEEVVDLTGNEPVPSSESPSVVHLLLSQGKDEDNLSNVEIELDANADDVILVSDSENTCDSTLDSSAATEAESPSREMAMAEGFALKKKSCSLPDDVKSLSPKSQEVTVHLPQKESLPSKEKVVKLFLFGSSSQEKTTFFKRPPKVLSINLKPLKESPSKPLLMQEQSAKQRVYEKWKTSIVPVLAAGKRKRGTQKSLSSLGGHRKRAAINGSTVTENAPIRSERGICKRKRNEKICLKLKRSRLSSTGKLMDWKVGSVPAPKGRGSDAVSLRENDVRMFRIPNTF